MPPRTVPAEVARRRARLAALARHAAAPDVLQAARDELAEANAEAAIRRIVDAWPPLTQAQLDKLALLLRPADAS